MSKKSKIVKMIEEFLCPGCISGSDTKCGEFKQTNIGGQTCGSHHPGTMLMGAGKILLGMPTGFNKMRENKVNVRFHEKGSDPGWDHLNVPVWAMVKDGYLFVRTFQPRLSGSMIDVIEGGTLDMVPQAIDVNKFWDEID